MGGIFGAFSRVFGCSFFSPTLYIVSIVLMCTICSVYRVGGYLGCGVYISQHIRGWRPVLTDRSSVANTPKVAINPENSGKMAIYTLFLPILVQILNLGAILYVIPYVYSLYIPYKG